LLWDSSIFDLLSNNKFFVDLFFYYLIQDEKKEKGCVKDFSVWRLYVRKRHCNILI